MHIYIYKQYVQVLLLNKQKCILNTNMIHFVRTVFDNSTLGTLGVFHQFVVNIVHTVLVQSASQVNG